MDMDELLASYDPVDVEYEKDFVNLLFLCSGAWRKTVKAYVLYPQQGRSRGYTSDRAVKKAD